VFLHQRPVPMLQEILIYVAVPAFLAIITYFAYDLFSVFYLNESEVTVGNSPLFDQNSDVVVFYKHQIGPYRNLHRVRNEIIDILPKGQARSLTIYYNRRELDNEKDSQAAVGCIYEMGGKPLFEKHFAYQLVRWGFEKMVLPPAERAVISRHHKGFLHTFLLNSKTYPRMRLVAAEVMGKSPQLSIEVESASDGYGPSRIDVLIPMEHHDEFIVPECLSGIRAEMEDDSSFVSHNEVDTDKGRK